MGPLVRKQLPLPSVHLALFPDRGLHIAQRSVGPHCLNGVYSVQPRLAKLVGNRKTLSFGKIDQRGKGLLHASGLIQKPLQLVNSAAISMRFEFCNVVPDLNDVALHGAISAQRVAQVRFRVERFCWREIHAANASGWLTCSQSDQARRTFVDSYEAAPIPAMVVLRLRAARLGALVSLRREQRLPLLQHAPFHLRRDVDRMDLDEARPGRNAHLATKKWCDAFRGQGIQGSDSSAEVLAVSHESQHRAQVVFVHPIGRAMLIDRAFDIRQRDVWADIGAVIAPSAQPNRGLADLGSPLLAVPLQEVRDDLVVKATHTLATHAKVHAAVRTPSVGLIG